MIPEELQTVRTLNNEGKLHKSLIFRIGIMGVMSVVLAGIVAYNVIFRDVSVLFAFPLAVGGLVLGLFVFSRMNAVGWDEAKEVIRAGRMDIVGFAALGVYIVVEIGLRKLLQSEFPNSFTATALLLATVSGMLLGRTIGTIIAIHKIHQDSLNKDASSETAK